MRISALVLAVLIAAQAKGADYNICNRTSEVLDVAYAITAMTIDPVFGSGSSGGVESQGWYGIQPGDCKNFTFNQSRHSAYFFAKGSFGNTYVGNSGSFCIRPGGQAFRYTNSRVDNANKCSQAGGQMLGFYHANPGTFNFNDDRTYVRYCNKTPGVVFHSTVMYEDNTWTSKGWGRLNAGECKVQSKGRYDGDLYIGGFWVDNGQKRFWQGPAEFCVHSSNAFEYPFANSMTCEGDKQRLGFYQMHVGRGVHNFNFQD